MNRKTITDKDIVDWLSCVHLSARDPLRHGKRVMLVCKDQGDNAEHYHTNLRSVVGDFIRDETRK